MAEEGSEMQDLFTRKKKKQVRSLSSDLNDNLQDAALQGRDGRRWFPTPIENRGELNTIRSYPEMCHILFNEPLLSRAGYLIFTSILFLIVLSSFSFSLETLPKFHNYKAECEVCRPVGRDRVSNGTAINNRLLLEDYCRTNKCEPGVQQVFQDIEFSCIILFTIEYVIRLVTAYSRPTEYEFDYLEDFDTWPDYYHLPPPLYRTISFIFNGLNLIDLFTITFYWLPLPSITVVRVLRLFRIFRIFKLGDVSAITLTFIKAFEISKKGLAVVIIMTLAIALVVSGLVFVCEKGDWDPVTGRFYRDALVRSGGREETPFFSVARTFWWAVTTFTTVGYGDMSPTTTCGQVFGVTVLFLGAFLLAMPITLVGSNFAKVHDELREQIRKQQQRERERGEKLLSLTTFADTLPLMGALRRWQGWVEQEKLNEQNIKYVANRMFDEFNVAPTTTTTTTEMENQVASRADREASERMVKLQTEVENVRVAARNDVAELKLWLTTEFSDLKRSVGALSPAGTMADAQTE